MGRFYVPYAGDKPASVLVNGHRLIILARDKTTFEDELSLIGADSLKVFASGNSQEEETHAFNKLARSLNAGVVIAPGDIGLQDVIRNLENQLPWLQ